MKILPYLICSALTLTACSRSGKAHKATGQYSEKRAAMEAEAQTRLQAARRLLENNQPEKARETVEKMRKDCYLAIDARTEGILLADSIDLQTARNELEAIDNRMQSGEEGDLQAAYDEACRKVKFYERKIQYDHSKSYPAP